MPPMLNFPDFRCWEARRLGLFVVPMYVRFPLELNNEYTTDPELEEFLLRFRDVLRLPRRLGISFLSGFVENWNCQHKHSTTDIPYKKTVGCRSYRAEHRNRLKWSIFEPEFTSKATEQTNPRLKPPRYSFRSRCLPTIGSSDFRTGASDSQVGTGRLW